jgi:hypothetical protein
LIGVQTDLRENENADDRNQYAGNVEADHTRLEIALGLAAPLEVGQVPPSKIVTIYGTSKQDAMDRAGIQ